MARIQSNIGLFSGIDIGNMVDQLMEVAARPRDLLVKRTAKAEAEQVAVAELSAMLLSFQISTNRLGNASLYGQQKVTSSNTATLAATLNGNPPVGNYRFTPLRTAQNQQWLSSGVRDATAALGGGSLSFRFGDHVERSTPLGLVNGGEGIVRGTIRITDRSGARADIDLSTANSIDDVLEAISSHAAINVTAGAWGDGIRLIDNTGQSVSNLIVQEVSGGTTAASLGLAGIDVATAVADGEDVLRLFDDIELAVLNDGNGVSVNKALPDIAFTLRNGTTGEINFWEVIPGGAEVEKQLTLGDIVEKINAAAPGELHAKICDVDGDRLVVEDLTTGGGAFELSAVNGSTALGHLGLDRAVEDGDTINGRRLLGGLKSVLLSSLGGGVGFGELGGILLTDRSGAGDTVDLAGAETLEEVVRRINEADVSILARVNQARNGIELLDTSGAQASNLIVADAGDGLQTATKLGIAVDGAVTKVNSGDMHLQVIARQTTLASLHGGRGVARGTISITNSLGQPAVIDLRGEHIQTIGDVIDAINQSNIDVLAELNDTGDGIHIRDLSGGGGTLAVQEGSTTTARDLGLLRDAAEVEIGGQPAQVINGSMTHVIELDESESLDDLLVRINELGAGVNATTFADGTSRPHRLALLSGQSGKQGALVVDASQLGLDFQEAAPARDALLLFGDSVWGASTGILASSASSRFRDVLPGTTLEVRQADGQAVTVTVEPTDTNLAAAAKNMVEAYNKFRSRLVDLTQYTPETNERSLLTGDSAALRLDNDLSYLMSGRFAGTGPIRSLGEVGFSLTSGGTLQFDEQRLKEAFAADPDAVTKFFTEPEIGVSDRFKQTIDQLVAEETSLLAQRQRALAETIERNEQRAEWMTGRLKVERERLLLQLYRMESAIGKMQSQLTAIEGLQPLAPLVATRQNDR